MKTFTFQNLVDFINKQDDAVPIKYVNNVYNAGDSGCCIMAHFYNSIPDMPPFYVSANGLRAYHRLDGNKIPELAKMASLPVHIYNLHYDATGNAITNFGQLKEHIKQFL